MLFSKKMDFRSFSTNSENTCDINGSFGGDLIFEHYSIEPHKGLRQGDGIFGLLFNIVFESVMSGLQHAGHDYQ